MYNLVFLYSFKGTACYDRYTVMTSGDHPAIFVLLAHKMNGISLSSVVRIMAIKNIEITAVWECKVVG